MTDEIRIEGLHLRTIIGINGEERRDRQDVLIDVVLMVDTRKAGRSDDIADAPVNYRTLTKRIIARVEDSRFHLIERLAEEIAALCLEETEVVRVRVEVRKPGALRFAGSVGVAIERGRNGG
ncbi:MAG TPA: dihydroneopterin aldolase [Geobacteraceae bacterium]|nr:dihydroneopterin aldolase [Geobacteraceae bacterium]